MTEKTVNTDKKRDDVMRKVQALLDRAASTTFEPERDECLKKADALMAAYAIEEFELAMARPASEREKPEVRTIVLPGAEDFDVQWQLRLLFSELARHCGVMVGKTTSVYNEGSTGQEARCVGYRSDLDWLQMLYINVQLHMVSRIEPKPDPAKTDVENFSALRDAGMDYERIFQLMGWPWEGESEYNARTRTHKVGHGKLTGVSAQLLRKMRKAYQDKCKAEGRTPVKGLKADTYKSSYLEGYVNGIHNRLYEMKQARTEATTGKGLVLANRDDDLKEAFFTEFPEQRPHPKDCECDSCHFVNCYDESCERPRCVRYRKDALKPVKARKYKEPKVDHDAQERGRQAAKTADLSRGDKVAGSSKAVGK